MHALQPLSRVIETTTKNSSGLILSVDDDARILDTRQKILESAGYDVLSASSGEEALRIFASVLVDLVVLDYSLPGIDGGGVAKKIKAERPLLPVIMVSGSTLQTETQSCVDDWLMKGQSPALLVNRSGELLAPPFRVYPQNG
jgi:CheY-like chemotaxis protein